MNNKQSLISINNYELKKPVDVLRSSTSTDIVTLIIPADEKVLDIICSLETEKIKEPYLTIKYNDEKTRYVAVDYYYDINIENLNEAEEIIIFKLKKV